MYTSDELLKKVNNYLKVLAYNRKPESLYEPIKYVLDLGGKRIRPILLLFGYNLYKESPENVLSSACALETYHNYTLLHDDLMDEASIRRGQPTVHRKWNANQAILSGDSMLVLAYERLAKCDARHLPAVLSLFTETALQIGEGQQYDMEFEKRDDVSVEEYIEMIRLKTSVLLACAIKMGAILADAPKEDAENLYKFGEQIGLAFQLQDDYLDVYGDPKVFGKEIGGDIVSNKKTYMLITAFNHANQRQREELEVWMRKTTFEKDEKITAVTRLYNEMGIDKLAKEKMDEFYEQSKKYLDAVSIPEEKKTELRAYAEQMMERQK
ncbi:UNVERIFIED_CONTAM: polyprenyl synthetase family protein [Prevotella sp. 15_C9]